MNSISEIFNKLPKYSGSVWRVDTGFTLSNLSVADVVKYETDELGNNLGQNLTLVMGFLETIPAKYCMWVTKNKNDAERYGEPVRFYLDSGVVLGADPDGGYLILDTKNLKGVDSITAEQRYFKRMAQHLRGISCVIRVALAYPASLGDRGVASAQLLENGVVQQKIYNADYVEAKQNLQRAFEKANDYFSHNEVDSRSFYEKHININQPSYLHNIAGYLKKKSKDQDPEIQKYVEFLKGWLPLAELLESVKTYVVKGRKPSENLVPSYKAPFVSLDVQTAVKEVLTELVASQLEALVEQLTGKFLSYLDEYMRGRESEYIFPHKYFKDRFRSTIVDGLVNYGRVQLSVQPKENAPEVARAKAIRYVTDLRDAFISKNLSKLGSILEKKGNLSSTRIIHGQLVYFGFSGEILFTFDDGSSFVVRNKAILKSSPRGQLFHQFPTTFHNIHFADGAVKSMMSEQEMNEVFAIA